MRRCAPQKLLLVLLAAFSLALIFSFLAANSSGPLSDRIVKLEGHHHRRRRPQDQHGIVAVASHGEEVDEPLGEAIGPLPGPGTFDRNACSRDASCGSPHIFVRFAAETAAHPPFVCLNDIAVFSDARLKRGVNVARLNGETLDVVDTAAFDVASSDEGFIDWLRKCPDNSVVIVASFGDVAERISPDARRSLERFGSGRIRELRAGKGYVMLGQRSLKRGSAREALASLGANANGLGEQQELFEGCIDFPLSPARGNEADSQGGEQQKPSNEGRGDMNRLDESRWAQLVPALPHEQTDVDVELGEPWVDCGASQPCASDTISMHFFSGANKDDHPKMCVAGYVVFEKGLNDAGRGLNVAVIDPKRRKVTRTAHFDTYEKESTDLELFLDSVGQGEILTVVSFDEASTMLSDMARQIFYELGSSMIHRLKFRSSWYFVGQKGIRVFTPFEDLNFATGNNWATPIDKSLCVPLSLSGPEKGKGAGTQGRNAQKRHFCAKYDRLDDFCDEAHLDDIIAAKSLSKSASRRPDDPVYNMPILVVAGINVDRLRHSLQSLIEQEGVNTQLVVVAHHLEYKIAGDLALLFHFKPLPLNTSSNYNDLLLAALDAGFSLFPRTTSLLVFEEEVEASPDLLGYLSQLLPTFTADNSIEMLQTFNFNGFNRTTGDVSEVYRVEGQPPAYAYLMKRSFYEKNIKGVNKTVCCSVLHNWRIAENSISLVPGLSRVRVPPPDAPSLASKQERRVFKERREYSWDEYPRRIADIQSLSADSYPKWLSARVAEGTVVDTEKLLRKCKEGEADRNERIKEMIKAQPEKRIVTKYGSPQELQRLLRCFGLYYQGDFIAGRYQQTVRFSLRGTEMLLVPR